MNITVSGYNRPEYLSQTLAALARCVGIGSCRVVVILDPSEETEKQTHIAKSFGFDVGVLSAHTGCNGTILAAMQYGFGEMQSEFHLHFEDDTVPARDALLWFSWARDRYRHDPHVLTVSGYQQRSNGHLDQCGRRRWFTPWGWGTWADRWREIAPQWSRGSLSWDIRLNDTIRGTRWEAFPTVSRIQNIGAEKGTHVANAAWHAIYHAVPVTADDIEGARVVYDFAEVEPYL